ncbi:MAG: DUF1800 family protein [Pseudomonadota bacterium]
MIINIPKVSLVTSLVTVSLVGVHVNSEPASIQETQSKSITHSLQISSLETKPSTMDDGSIEELPTLLATTAESLAFFMKASLGYALEEAETWVNRDAAEWLQQEFVKPYQAHVLAPLIARDQVEPLPTNGQYHVPYIWDALLKADDQLRQRMMFALSQILVVSDNPMTNQALEMGYYYEQLSKNSFGNYRQLLEDVTYSHFMARYLSYLGNRKGDPITGRTPDENYAREILQLFSIGLIELNKDGTPKLDSDGNEIETYSNEDIIGLARVFTGLYSQATEFAKWKTRAEDFETQPLKMFEDFHSPLEKTFLGITIPAGTSGTESINIALDRIFAHPNVGPFISRILIQRFTATHPSPEYVERVATAFDLGSYTAANGLTFGENKRGDLKATLAAILLDEEVHSVTETTTGYGKIREPILNFSYWVRSMKIEMVDSKNEHALYSSKTSPLGQHPFRSPSVFNFYRPGFIAPSTESANLELTTPELQLYTPIEMFKINDTLSTFIYNKSSKKDKSLETFYPAYHDEKLLAENPEALVEHLNLLLTAQRLTAQEKTDIIEAVSATVIRENQRDFDLEKRVQLAVNLIMLSPNYFVIR